MKKIKTIIMFCLGTLTIVGSSFSFAKTNSYNTSSSSQHTSNCNWNHYSFVAPSYENNGVNEYWVCCDHHDVSMTQPVEGHITDKGQPDTSFTNSLSDSDERVILSYKKQVSHITSKIEGLDDTNMSVNDIKKINTIEKEYNELSDSLKQYVKNYQDLLGFKYAWNCNFANVADGNSLTFTQREYVHASYSEVKSSDAEVGNTLTLTSVSTTDDTFWVFPNVDVDLSAYTNVYFFVRAKSANVSMQIRVKTDYSSKFGFTCLPNQWSLVTVNLATYSISNLKDIGIASWKGKAFSLESDIEISSFFASKKDPSYTDIIFDSSVDTFINNIYAATYTQNHVSDSEKGTVVSLSNMSNTSDALWFKPTKYFNITNYQYIMFYIKPSIDRAFTFRASSNYNLVFEGFQTRANKWNKVMIEVNDNNFPTGLISDLGIANWGQHEQGAVGTWLISSIYGIGKKELSNAEIIDGIKVPLITSEKNIDFTAYATPTCKSSNGDTVFTQARKAGFTKAIGLLDGRDSATQDAFNEAFTNYLTITRRTTKKKNALITAIDNFVSAIDDANRTCVYYANKNGIGYYALADILYDYRMFCGGSSALNNDDYKLIAEEVFSKATYMQMPEYYGEFLADEPALKDDLTRYSTVIQKYLSVTNGEPFINLLPHDDVNTRSNYDKYVNSYFTNIFPLLGYVSYDSYPLRTTGIKETHLLNLEIFAQKIKSVGGGQLRTFINSLSPDQNTIHGNDSANDFRFQIYSNLAFGSNDIAYFCYTSNNDPTTGTTGGLVNYSSLETSNLYSYASEVNHEVQEFGLAFNHFDWDAVIATGSSTPISKLEHTVSTYGKLTAKSASTSTLIGCFKDSNSNNAYLVMNYQDPNSASLSDDITLSFDNTVDAAIVYKNGTKHAYLLSNGNLTLNLDVANGAFVIPVKTI